MLSYLDLWSLAEGKGAPSFFNTVKAYVDDGWNITLIQPKSKYRQDYKVEGCRMIKFNNTFFDFCNKIPKVRFFMKFLAFYYVTFQFYKKANEIISKNKKNYIIYSYEVHAVKAGAKLAKKYNFPLITRFQGTILTEKPYNLLNRIIKFPHYEALKRKSDIVIMTNDGTRGDEVLKRLHNKSEKVLFWKNGQDPIKPAKEIKEKRSEIRTKYGIAMETPIMLTVSRLQSWKRVDRAIVAMEKVVKEYPKAKLIVVGSGEEYNNLVNLSKELNLKDNIIFTGAVKQEEVWMYYSCADIFLSLYDLSNMGNPLMEAMRYGKIIITLDNGNTRNVIRNKENGILIALEKVDKIPIEISKLLKDKKKIVELSRNAAKYSQGNFWTWEERMQAELKKINKLLLKNAGK